MLSMAREGFGGLSSSQPHRSKVVILLELLELIVIVISILPNSGEPFWDSALSGLSRLGEWPACVQIRIRLLQQLTEAETRQWIVEKAVCHGRISSGSLQVEPDGSYGDPGGG